MTTRSSQRWAIGAVTLAVLIACSPKPEAPAVGTIPPAPAETTPPPLAEPAPPAAFVPSASDPGYAGVWAAATADCPDASRTFLLTGETLNLAPMAKTCAVKTLDETHPTGRSAIFAIKAACLSDPAQPAGAEAAITLNFGASDTVMQMTVNQDAPVTLERCPLVTP